MKRWFSCQIISLTICSYCIISRSLGQENLIMKNAPKHQETDAMQALTGGPQESSLQVLDLDFLTCKTKGFDQVSSGSHSYAKNL